MKHPVVTAIILTVLGSVALASSANAQSYKSLISDNCYLRSHDPAKDFFDDNLKVRRGTVGIRRVVRLGRGWVRIHATGYTKGRAAWGYADYNTRSGQVICDPADWHVDPPRNLRMRRR